MLEQLDDAPERSVIETDVAIVGGGACGLTLARQLAQNGLDVIVLESGTLDDSSQHEALNKIVADPDLWTDAQLDDRTEFFKALTKQWSQDNQPFGIRCRGLGGSTRAWAGKSAAFDPIDYERRSWIANTGWPLSIDDIAPYIDRASKVLNLGPNTYDDRFWDLTGQPPPEPTISPESFSSFFWQFARGRVNPLDTMRFGDEFLAEPEPGVRVFLNATVVNIDTTKQANQFTGFDVSTINHKRVKIRARTGVLAAGAIENARLLLSSRDDNPAGLGNENDTVGRYLTDHLMTPLGWFNAEHASDVSKRFGFYGLRHEGRSHMYAHGLQLAAERQRAEGLVNAAVFLLEDRTPDDPFSAIARLVKRRSNSPLSDLGLILRNPIDVMSGVGLRILESDRMPDSLRQFIIEQALRRFPNRAAREYRFRGLSHKLEGVRAHAICEQTPDRNNRVFLSDQVDSLGQPLPKVEWRTGDLEKRTALRMGELFRQSFKDAGLPTPEMPDWVNAGIAENAPLIDAGHTMGTTRMATNAKSGVVDLNCQIHGVRGLFAIGGSVMPTTGHANPTLMMSALTLRLADHIQKISDEPKIEITRAPSISSPERATTEGPRAV